MPSLRIAAAVPLAVLAFAACGGEDGPSREEFAAEAEKICADLERQGDRLSQSEPDNIGEIATFAQEARGAAEDAVNRIGELEVPGGDEGETAQQWKDAVENEANDQLIPALDSLEKAAKDNDPQALQEAAQQLQQLDESSESDRLAREIGAEGCAD